MTVTITSKSTQHTGLALSAEGPVAAWHVMFQLDEDESHLVVAPDDTIAKTVAALKDTFKVENVAPGHCTGEPTFAALKQAFGNRYTYAGVGTSLPLGPSTGAGERRGEGPVLEEDDLTTYRKLARREDPFGVRARSLR